MRARVQIEYRDLEPMLNVMLSIDMRVNVSRFKAQHLR
jgi:hypothetical protein